MCQGMVSSVGNERCAKGAIIAGTVGVALVGVNNEGNGRLEPRTGIGFLRRIKNDSAR